MSARVGIGVAYLSRVENGHRGARWHTVMRLLRALDATLADLGDAIDHASVAASTSRMHVGSRSRSATHSAIRSIRLSAKVTVGSIMVLPQ